ncbi:MAG: hemerythrin domain-containing protein [Acidovorax sp.]|nr:hemerythrin domain-containing protein [Acidovorax sp.]
MPPVSLQIIREEHASLAAVLQSLRLLMDQGPGDNPATFFDVMRAMLFYIDEFPERQHHPKESECLFPRVALCAPHVAEVIARLDKEHESGEAAVRELQHLLLGWELMGEGRREAFVQALGRYIDFYLNHMRLEETQVLPAAQAYLGPEDWAAVDAAFATNTNPLTHGRPRDPAYDRLFTRIAMRAPSPIGLG